MIDSTLKSKIWQRSPGAALQYEQWAARFILGPWVPYFLESIALTPGEQVLDVACGTGIVTRLAAQHLGADGQVTGLDIHPDMLSVAQRTAPQDGATILWKEGDAVTLPFRDASFDVVLCQQGLQFFPDRPMALQQMNRVLIPGGRVGIIVWSTIDQNPYFLALANAVERHIGHDAVIQMRSSFELGDKVELRRLISNAGFRGVVVNTAAKSLSLPALGEFIPRHLSGTSLAESVASLSKTGQKTLVTDVTTALASYARTEGIDVPFTVHLAIGVTES